jgi:hypothetical protein
MPKTERQTTTSTAPDDRQSHRILGLNRGTASAIRECRERAVFYTT